jgi:hypothetical protein
MQRAPKLFNIVRVPELLRLRTQTFNPQPLPLVLPLAPPLPVLELVPPTLLLLPLLKSG